EWWLGENMQHRYVWPGLSVGRRDRGSDETVRQIEVTRQLEPRSPGNVLWSVESVIGDVDKDTRQRAAPPPLYDLLQRGPYAQAALVPACPWLDNTPPPAPTAGAAKAANGAVTLTLRPGAGEPTAHYAVWARYGDRWLFTT